MRPYKTDSFSRLKSETPFVIIGGGIAGLFTGYYLKQKNIPFEIWEASDQVGGKIGTLRTELGLVELAANGIVQDSLFLEFAQHLKLPTLAANSKLKRILIDQNHLIKRPSLKGMWQLLIHGRKKISSLNSHEDWTLTEWLNPWLGQERSEEFLSAMTRGVYGLPAYELHGLSLLPNLNQASGSYLSFIKDYKKNFQGMKTVSFEGGMQTLVDLLGNYLAPWIHKNKKITNAQEIPWEKNIILACGTKMAGHLLESKSPALSKVLKKIDYVPLATTTFFLSEKISALSKCFGALLTPRTSKTIYGILANSEIFPNRVKHQNHHSYTIIHSPEISWDELKNYVQNFFQISGDPFLFHHTTLWPEAVPKYNSQRWHALNEISHHLSQSTSGVLDLNFHGGFVGPWITIGIKDILHQAKTISDLASS